MGPMWNLEHPGAVMREWWLEGADPAEAADRLGVDPGALQGVLDGRCGISPELAALLEAGDGLPPPTGCACRPRTTSSNCKRKNP